jgi:hypothetical protein
MSLILKLKDILHKIVVKFVPVTLPTAKKKYNVKVVKLNELTIKEVAAKAAVYNVGVPPKTIIDGFNAGVELLCYMIADGYNFKCPLFYTRIRIPGEYDGSETALPDGLYPELRLNVSEYMRNYMRNHVQVIFAGFDKTGENIAEVIDDETGEVNRTITRGSTVTVSGSGLKIESGDGQSTQTGAFLADSSGAEIRVKSVVLNYPSLLKLLMPDTLTPNECYAVVIRTQVSAKDGKTILKNLREIRSDCNLKAR